MNQRFFAVNSRSRAPRKGVWPCGIGRPITSDAPKPGFSSPSWHFWAMGKLVGNCTGHPAQMAGASEEDFGSRWHTLARSSVSEDAVGQKSSRPDCFIAEHAHGGIGGADLRHRARAKATVLRMTLTRSVARPTTSNRHIAGRGLVPRQAYAESGGGPDGPLPARNGDQSGPGRRGEPRDTNAHMMAAAGEQVCGRSDRSVGGPT